MNTENNEKINVILVGRHTGDLPENINIVEQKAITWSVNPLILGDQWRDLVNEAQAKNCRILLQNVPGVLATIFLSQEFDCPVPIGVVISVAGERLAGVEEVWSYDFTRERDYAIQLAKTMNPRAKIEIIDHWSFKTTIDPVNPFVFNRIEWD